MVALGPMTARPGYPPDTRPMHYDTPERRHMYKCSFCGAVHTRDECPHCGAPVDELEIETR